MGRPIDDEDVAVKPATTPEVAEEEEVVAPAVVAPVTE
jgi:hypothetical protein